MFGGDPQHSGRNSTAGPEAPVLQWSFPATNPSAPAVANNGTVYLPAVSASDFTTGVLYAIDSSGNQIWKSNLPFVPAKTSPSIGPDGTIYVRGLYTGPIVHAMFTESVSALSPSGNILWTFSATVFDLANSGLAQHSPLVAPDGTVYVSFENFVFYALNKDGSVRWSRNLSGAPFTAATIGVDGTIYINNFSNLIALNPAGNVTWSVPLSSSGGLGWPSIGADGVVYLDTANGLYAFNPSNGAVQWQVALPGSVTSATPSIGADGTIYQIAGTSLVALTSAGSILWSVNQNVGNASSATQGAAVIGADGIIYTRTNNKVFALNSTGTQKWALNVPNSFSGDGSIVLANSAVYVNSNDLCVSCFSGVTKYK